MNGWFHASCIQHLQQWFYSASRYFASSSLQIILAGGVSMLTLTLMCEAIISVSLTIILLLTNMLGIWVGLFCSLGATCRVLSKDNHEVRIKYLLVQEIFTWLIIWRMLTASLRFLVLALLVKGVCHLCMVGSLESWTRLRLQQPD